MTKKTIHTEQDSFFGDLTSNLIEVDNCNSLEEKALHIYAKEVLKDADDGFNQNPE